MKIVPHEFGLNQRRALELREMAHERPGPCRIIGDDVLSYPRFVQKLFCRFAPPGGILLGDEERDACVLRRLAPLVRRWIESRQGQVRDAESADLLARSVLAQIMELKRRGVRPDDLPAEGRADFATVEGFWREVFRLWRDEPFLDGADREWLVAEALAQGSAPPPWLSGGAEVHVPMSGLTPGQRALWRAMRQAGVYVSFRLVARPSPADPRNRHVLRDLPGGREDAEPSPADETSLFAWMAKRLAGGEDSGHDDRAAGRDGGTAGRDGRMAGRDGGTAGRDGRMAGRDGGTAGGDGGTAGRDGGTAGRDGGTAGSDGGTAGRDGRTAGRDGARPSRRGRVVLWRCPSRLREARQAAAQACKWLDEGVPPEAVALAVPRFEAVRGVYEAELERYGVPFQTRLGSPALEHGMVRWALDLLQAAQESLPFEVLGRLLRSPWARPLWPEQDASGNDWLARTLGLCGYFDEDDQHLDERLRAVLAVDEQKVGQASSLSSGAGKVAEQQNGAQAGTPAPQSGQAGSLSYEGEHGQRRRAVRRVLWLMTGEGEGEGEGDSPKLLLRLRDLKAKPGDAFLPLLSALSAAFENPQELADRSAKAFLGEGVELARAIYGEDASPAELLATLRAYLEKKRVLYRPERKGIYLLDLPDMAGARFRKAIAAGLLMDAFPGAGASPNLLGAATVAAINAALESRGLDPLPSDLERRQRRAALWADIVASVEEELILSTPVNRETRADEQDSVAVLETAALFAPDPDEEAWAKAHGLGDDPAAGRLPIVEFPLAEHLDFGRGPDARAAQAWEAWQGEAERARSREGRLDTANRSAAAPPPAAPETPDASVAFRRGVCLARRAWLGRVAAEGEGFRAREALASEASPWDAWCGRLSPELAKQIAPPHFSPTAAETFHRGRLAYLYERLFGVEPDGPPDEAFSALLKGSIVHELVQIATHGTLADRQWRTPGSIRLPEARMKELVRRAYEWGEGAGRRSGEPLALWDLRQALEFYRRTEPEAPWAGWECAWEAPLKGVRLALGGGRSWPLRGYIDRLAREGGQLYVVDYKNSTGSSYGQSGFRDEATLLQGPLYRFVASCLPEEYFARWAPPGGEVLMDMESPDLQGRPEALMKYHFLRQTDPKNAFGYPYSKGRKKNAPDYPPLEEEAETLREAIAAFYDAFHAHGDFRSGAGTAPFTGVAWLTREYDANGW